LNNGALDDLVGDFFEGFTVALLGVLQGRLLISQLPSTEISPHGQVFVNEFNAARDDPALS
jgi:hypothetical protein